MLFRSVGDTALNTEELNRDLTAEQQALDDVLAPLTDEQWSLQTPSPRWSVADQVAHLTYFDRAAVTAMGDPDAFTAEVEALIGALGTGSAADSAEAMDRHTLEQYRVLTPAELLATWRRGRSQLSDAAMSLDDGDRVPWFGPSMSSRSFLTARLMEVWAHGQDVCDAVGVAREPTARLAHIARLGFLTRGWSYVNRGMDAPVTELRVQLDGPGGERWTFGPEHAAQQVTGDAEEFCLVVTQRRHVDDTSLRVVGDDALGWMTQAQAFAGPPTDPPVPT